MRLQKPLILNRFNSIKVRLKVDNLLKIIAGAVKFQFHKGAIKRKEGSLLFFPLKQSFNSIKVRLKVVIYSYDGSDVETVSIP